MAYSKPVMIPLLNTNEPEASLVAVHVEERQEVKEGDVLFTLETTKSTADVVAERDGYIVEINYQAGASVQAGEVFCHLANTPDWELRKSIDSNVREKEQAVPDGLRITQPALKLARKMNLSLASLPVGPLITESMIKDHLIAVESPAELKVTPTEFNPTAIVVYGGGGHGKSVIELIRAVGGYQIVGVIDDGIDKGEDLLGVPVLGGAEALPELYQKGVRQAANAVGGIGNIKIRVTIFERLAQAGFICPIFVHPTAFVEATAKLSAGSQVFPLAYVGSDAEVGFGCIVNTSAVVSHDCVLGDYANISPGALLAGAVEIGAGCLVGMGVTINVGVMVGDQAKLGNSAVVKTDVPAKRIVRAGAVWPE